MRRSSALVIATVGLSVLPAMAEERVESKDVFSAHRLAPLVRQAADRSTRPALQDAAAREPRRDSIWNGGLIGAAIGGVGGSALIVASRGGSDDIPRAMLNVCAVPAIAGFAVGAIVDALK